MKILWWILGMCIIEGRWITDILIKLWEKTNPYKSGIHDKIAQLARLPQHWHVLNKKYPILDLCLKKLKKSCFPWKLSKRFDYSLYILDFIPSINNYLLPWNFSQASFLLSLVSLSPNVGIRVLAVSKTEEKIESDKGWKIGATQDVPTDEKQDEKPGNSKDKTITTVGIKNGDIWLTILKLIISV